METPAGVRVNRSAVLASLGLSTNLLWCTLAGHTGGFPSSCTTSIPPSIRVSSSCWAYSSWELRSQ